MFPTIFPTPGRLRALATRASGATVLVRRFSYVAAMVAYHVLVRLAAARLARWPRFARRFPALGLDGPARLRQLLMDLGGSFIKLGQMLSLQPDILPFDYCNALYDLMDRVRPIPADEVAAIFRAEVGRSPAEAFDRFDRAPIATASIGQVHAAYAGGRKWAVKVQRPGVRVEFGGDIRLMAAAIWVIKRLRLRAFYWVLEPLGEFVKWTNDELDFRREARHLELFHRNSAAPGRERIPAVRWDLTTERVLVTEFLDGVTVLDYLRAAERRDDSVRAGLVGGGFDPDQFARNVIDNFLGEDFRRGMFHADLHPANILILDSNVVGYIDFGITGALSPYARRHLTALTLAYTRADAAAMCDSFFRISAVDDDSDPEAFTRGLRRLFDEWSDAAGGVRRARRSITLVMLDMLRLSRETRIWPERDVIKYIRSAIAIDGLVRSVAPGFDVNRHLATVCERYLKWLVWREVLTFDTMVSLIGASGHLLRDGLPRAVGALDRARDRPRAGAAATEARGASRAQSRALRVGALTFGLSLVVREGVWPGPRPTDLDLAGSALLAAAALSFFRSLARAA